MTLPNNVKLAYDNLKNIIMIKNNIFLYLFVFAVLIAVFQVVNSKKILDKYERDLSRLEIKNLKLKDSIQIANDKIFDLSHFSFQL